MSYIAYNPERFLGKSVGSGQCVAFVEAAAHTHIDKHWKQGEKVKNNHSIVKGMAIATFRGGWYVNNTSGFSHAAIYLKQTHEGIYVLDQWVHNGERQPVHERLIRFKNGCGKKPVDDGDAYYIIEDRPDND